jgi:hypothetical protein
LLHATAAWQDTFLQAATNFLRDPHSPQVSFFGFARRPGARCRPLCRFNRMHSLKIIQVHLVTCKFKECDLILMQSTNFGPFQLLRRRVSK